MKPGNSLLPIALLCGLLFCCTGLQAQYDIRIGNPAYSSSENPQLSLEAVRFTPGRITLEMAYTAISKDDGYRLGRQTKLFFEEFANGGAAVKEVKGVDYTNFTRLKQGSTGRFSASFPFSFFDLVIDDEGWFTEEALDRFLTPTPLVMDLVECTDSYKQLNDVTGCFNISGIRLPVKEEDMDLMLCYGFLDAYLQKSEFETTVKYQQRIHADTVQKKLRKLIEGMELLTAMSYHARLAEERQELAYDADQETFTLKFPGARPVRVKVPIATAPAFKKNYQSGALVLTDLAASSDQSGTFVIRSLTFTEGKKERVLNNLDWPATANLLKEKQDRVLATLRKVYPKNTGFSF